LPFGEDALVVNSNNHAPWLILKFDELPRFNFAHDDFENLAVLFFGFCNQSARAHPKAG
jgi:hypothetical protein